MQCLQLAVVLPSSVHKSLILSMVGIEVKINYETIHLVNRAGESTSLSAAFFTGVCLHIWDWKYKQLSFDHA